MDRKHIRVAAAVLIEDRKVFAAQRGYGPQKGGYELPGGKLEPNESGKDAIVREIREELGAQIAAERLLMTVEHDYPEFHLTMECWLCRIESGELKLSEHTAARWLRAQELEDVPWLPADAKALPILRELLQA